MRIGQAVGDQQAQVLLGREDFPGFLVRAGGDDDLGEDVGDGAGVGAVQRTVDRDHPAEGRDGVAFQRAGVGFRQVLADGHAARVGVLHDDHGGLFELGHQLIGGVGVGDVVVAQLLALDLGGVGHTRTALPGAVEGARLVRVLSVAQGLGQRTGDRLAGGSFVADLTGEPARDGGVIGGGAGEGAGGQTLAQLQRGGAIGLQGFQNLIDRILVDADGHIAVVLRGRADHGRSADVDVLDGGFKTAARGHGGLERIEVDPGDIDAADAVFGHGCGVGWLVPHAQQAAVHHRVQGLDPAVHHFREAGQIGHILHRQAEPGDGGAGAAGRDQLDAEIVQGAGGLFQTGLVAQRNQGALRRHAVGRGGKVGSGGHGDVRDLEWGRGDARGSSTVRARIEPGRAVWRTEIDRDGRLSRPPPSRPGAGSGRGRRSSSPPPCARTGRTAFRRWW